jgi:hypothetical protein
MKINQLPHPLIYFQRSRGQQFAIYNYPVCNSSDNSLVRYRKAATPLLNAFLFYADIKGERVKGNLRQPSKCKTPFTYPE